MTVHSPTADPGDADAGHGRSFPRQHARTQRFTLGAPRSFTVAGAEGRADRVVFLRSPSAENRATCLWSLELDGGGERLLGDPAVLLGGAEEALSPQERARRERVREGSAGVVGYAVDAAGTVVAFTLSGRLFVTRPATGRVRELTVPGPVIDPRPAPDGRHVAYVAGGALRVVAADGSTDRALAEPDGRDVTWGLAEFVAAEEMQRQRGFWWSPDSDRLVAARVDNTPVDRWWIGDPANPHATPTQVAYPAAGTANAEVSAWLVDLDGGHTPISWDRAAFPYLVSVHWSAGGDPLLAVMSRDQRTQLVLAVDPATGATRTVHVQTDPVWIDIVPGAPAWTPDGRLVRVADVDGARRLFVGERELTGADLHVRAVLDVGAQDVLITASAGPKAAASGSGPRGSAHPDTGEVHVYRVGAEGAVRVSDGPGVHSAARAAGVTVLTSSSLEWSGARVSVQRDGVQIGSIASRAAVPELVPNVELLMVGARRIPCAVLLPTGWDPSDGGRLPVLMDPYGGPHGQRVVAARNAHLVSQWFADQGFAVVVADGRGTPHHGPDWEKAVRDGFTLTLDDQVEALHALAAERPYLDLGRVGVRGWSYGGYLAALAVLRRPDVFHVGVVGAPVTDWALYDTHYTERYLGDPADQPAVYRANSLVTGSDLGECADPVRPMMIVHGLADDNVVVANTLRLSSALLAAGRAHTVLPLSGVTHMTPQEQVAENLLLLQVDFLRRGLGIG